MDRPSYLLVTPEYPEAAPIFRLCNIDLEGGRAAGIVTTEGACRAPAAVTRGRRMGERSRAPCIHRP